MNYDEFLNKCKEIYIEYPSNGELQEFYYDETNRWQHRSERKKIEKPRLYVEWSTGGVSGGSCWDNSNPQPYTSNDPPKDLDILDAILEAICPIITFLQYKNLCNTLIEYNTYSVGEYYGNSTNYAYKQMDLEKLYNYLNEKGFLG